MVVLRRDRWRFVKSAALLRVVDESERAGSVLGRVHTGATQRVT